MNYTNNLRRLGFTDDDLANGGSDRLIDGIIVGRRGRHRGAERARWRGRRSRVHPGRDRRAAAWGSFPREQWRALRPRSLGFEHAADRAPRVSSSD